MQKTYRLYGVGGCISAGEFKTVKDAVLEAKKRAESNRVTYYVVGIEAKVEHVIVTSHHLKIDYAEEPTDTSEGACPKGSPATQPSRQGSRSSD